MIRRYITLKSSKQYKFQHTVAYTGNYGIRMINGRYCAAIGTGYDISVGDYVDLVLQNGTIIPIIISDIKDREHYFALHEKMGGSRGRHFHALGFPFVARLQ